MTGKVYLVGAGPGDPDLLTLKAFKLLKSADVVLHDDLIGPEILAFIPSSTDVHNVGKRFGRKSVCQSEIHTLMIQNALLGLQVVRMKSGDPLIFGRAGEEIDALRKAGIEFEIVPGVTAAFGAAASAQIPLTHRQVSSAVVLVTGHHAASDEFADWPAKIPTDATVVVYMPGYDYRSTAQQLERAGVAGTTPCAIVSQATSPTEQIHLTTVQELHTSPRLPSPTLLVVGEVVRLAKPAALHQQFAWPGDAPGSGASLRLHSDFASNGAASFGAQERAE
jgi:uroporphyrin-III C-methyltransferase